MYTIENDFLRVAVNPIGAELSSLFNKENGREYMWSGDADYWGKQSPVLFPIVGTLKDNQYFFEGQSYELSRHGFAREKRFSVKSQTSSAITFELQQDENTLKVFPFHFSFSIIYTLEQSRLSVSYLVQNQANEAMCFSVGGHPAFKLPIANELAYEDYFLLFNKTEHAGKWPISSAGLIETSSLPFFDNTNRLPLAKSLFYKDALVFKNLLSDEVQVRSDKHPSGFTFSFGGFPYLGIWAAKDADFICIEPWCGIADGVNTNQEFKEKEGVITLPTGENFERTWSVTLW